MAMLTGMVQGAGGPAQHTSVSRQPSLFRPYPWSRLEQAFEHSRTFALMPERLPPTILNPWRPPSSFGHQQEHQMMYI